MSAYNEDAMRARFWEAKAEKERLEAEAQPHRKEYERLNREIEKLLAKQRAAAEKFKAIEAPCFDLSMEMAALARALKGKTGPAPAP